MESSKTLVESVTVIENVSIKFTHTSTDYRVTTTQDGIILRDRFFGDDEEMARAAVRHEVNWASGVDQ